MTEVGAVVRLRVTAAANGGHCVGRSAEGQVVFVRHTLPGELVDATITGVGKGGRYLLADATSIIEPAPGRVRPMCDWAGRCGGCDFQHASATAQREIKRDIVVDLLQRIGKLTDIAGTPIADAVRIVDLDAPADASAGYGIASRSRVRYVIGPGGVPSMRGHHSHDLVPVGSCPLGGPALAGKLATVSERLAVGAEVECIEDDDAAVHVVVDGEPDDSDLVVRRVGERSWYLQPTGFWQVHPRAAEVLSGLVVEAADFAPGQRVLDLYAGAGLFTAAAALAVGAAGRVDAVESSVESVNDGATALSDLEQVFFHGDDVARWLRSPRGPYDVVVLDPPRAGAGANIVRGIVATQPAVVVYVSCDAATFARDAHEFASHGYRLDDLCLVDLFPMTGHTETVARFARAD